jgi:hypothetical protein
MLMREHIRRFGQYVLDMDVLALPLNRQPPRSARLRQYADGAARMRLGDGRDEIRDQHTPGDMVARGGGRVYRQAAKLQTGNCVSFEQLAKLQ